MKKFIAIILLSAAILLSLCSCATVDSQAEALIKEWNESEDLVCSFSGDWYRLEDDASTETYVVTVQLPYVPTSSTSDMTLILICGDVREQCYQSMLNVFEGSGKNFGFVFQDYYGDLFALYHDGEFEWYY